MILLQHQRHLVKLSFEAGAIAPRDRVNQLTFLHYNLDQLNEFGIKCSRLINDK